MVGYVARTRTPLCVSDVRELIPLGRYKNTIQETHSAMAVPLLWDDNEVLGVLHIESIRDDAFTPAQLASMKAAALELTQHLLVLRAVERQSPLWCGWHPEVHGWDLSRVFRRVCYQVRQLDPAGLQAVIWTVDSVTQELYVSATTGHAGEFQNRETLPLGESFHGEVATLPTGAMGVVRFGGEAQTSSQLIYPDGTQRPGRWGFRKYRENGDQHIREVVSAPIHVGDDPNEHARACFSVYCLDDPSQKMLPDRMSLARTTLLLGDLMQGYFPLLKELAVARLRSALYNRRQTDGGFDAIIQTLRSIFDLDAGSVFCVTTGPNPKIEAVASLTGFGGDPSSSCQWCSTRGVWVGSIFTTRAYSPKQ